MLCTGAGYVPHCVTRLVRKFIRHLGNKDLSNKLGFS